MKREMLFRHGGGEIILPVTPAEYEVEHGNNIEIVNIYQLGDVAIVGYGTLAVIKIACLFPAHSYHFSTGGDPEEYISAFTGIVDSREEIRFLVSDTGVRCV